MKKILSTALLLAVLLTVAASCRPTEFVLMNEDMRPYFSLTRADYTGVTVPVPPEYEVTDAMVDAALQAVINEHTHAIPGKTIEDGDYVGYYIRGEYDGQPLPDLSSNYSGSPTYTTLSGEDEGLLPELYSALIGKLPKDYNLLREYGGTAKADDAILFSYYGYYYDDNLKPVVYAYASGLHYDLAASDLPLLVQSAVGKTVGEEYRYFRKEVVDGVETTIGYITEMVDGVERQVYYACKVLCRITEETAIEFTATLSSDMYDENSPYAYLNGQTVTFYAVPTGVYRRPTLDADFFLLHYGFEAEEGEDVVSAFKAYLRSEIEADIAEEYLYDYVYEYFLQRLKPDSFPKEMGLETAVPKAVDDLLNDPDLPSISSYYGMTEEEFLRKQYGLNTEEYASMEIREALEQYIWNENGKQMLCAYLLQVENLRLSDEEYAYYLDEYTKEYNEQNGTNLTSEQMEALFNQTEEEYFREHLEIQNIKMFLYENNTFDFTEKEE